MANRFAQLFTDVAALGAVGNAPPSAPSVGALWSEVTQSGFVQNWFWNGTYWLSQQLFVVKSEAFNSAQGASNLRAGLLFCRTAAWNLYITDIAAGFVWSGSFGPGSWAFELFASQAYESQTAVTGASITFTSANVPATGAASNWVSLTQQGPWFLEMVNSGLQTLFYEEIKTGTISTTIFWPWMQVSFRYARP